MNKTFIETAKEKFVNFLDDYDAKAWPAFMIFALVVSLGMALNYFGFLPVLGPLPALIISGLFEAAIMGWKVVSSRNRNDANQNLIAQWATWLSVGLAVWMLGINLFRVGGDTHFENTSYLIVTLAGIVQVVAFLFFDMADPDKQMAREFGQSQRAIVRQQQNAKNVISKADADMDVVRMIYAALDELDRKYSDIPGQEKIALLEEARLKLLALYAPDKKAVAEASRSWWNKKAAPVEDKARSFS